MTIIFFIFLSIPIISASQRLKLPTLEITSSAFESSNPIPNKYTLYGENISPDINLSNIPPETQSFSLILEDPGAAGGTWVHYLVKDIPKNKKNIKENENPGIELQNSWGYSHYGGPKPPKNSGLHHYYWRIYALDEEKMAATNIEEFKREIEEHKIGEGFLMGTYES